MIWSWILSWSAGKALSTTIDNINVKSINIKLNNGVRTWADSLNPKLEYPDPLFAWYKSNKNTNARLKLSKCISAEDIPDISIWEDALMESYLSVQVRLGDRCHDFFKQGKEQNNDNIMQLARILHGICLKEENFFKKAVIYYNQDIHSKTNKILDVASESSRKIKELESQIEAMVIEMRQRFNHLSKEANFPDNQQSIDSFVANSLGLDNDWVDSDRMHVFENALAEYNAKIIDRRNKFAFNQSIVMSMFKISDLRELTDAWNKNSWNPENLDHIQLIQGGMMAYSCLEQIPKDILGDLRMLNWCPIHHGFFNGYLGGFIRELKLEIQSKTDLVKKYQSDQYLFENLTRIIRSLKQYLEFNVNDLYSEIEKAIIIKKLPKQFLMVITSKKLTLRDADNCASVLASLPLNKHYKVSKAEVLQLQDDILIIACTAQESFYWNPQKDIAATVFYRTKDHEHISNILDEVNREGDILTIMQIGDRIIEFTNFEENLHHKLDRTMTLKKINDGFVGVPSNYYNSSGVILYHISNGFRIEPLLNIDELRLSVRKDKAISSWLEEREKDANDFQQSLNDLQHIYAFSLSHVSQNLVVIRGQISRTGILVLVRVSDSEAEILNIVQLEKSSSITIDAKNIGKSIHLCCGYLDLHRVDAVMELLEFREFQLVNSRTIERPKKDQDKVRDIFEICFGEGETIYLNEEGEKLLKYSNINETFTEYDFTEEESINHIQFVDMTLNN